MPRARWRKITFLLTLLSLSSAAGLSAQDPPQCELLVLPDSAAGRSFVYLLDKEGKNFLEARVDEELNPGPSTNLELISTLKESHEACKNDYLGPGAQPNADWANNFAQHFRYLDGDTLPIVDTVPYPKGGGPLSAFIQALKLGKTWSEVLTTYNQVGDPEWNSLSPRLLRIPRNERQLKVVRVKNNDFKPARGSRERDLTAATVIANLKKRGIEGLHLASFVANAPKEKTNTPKTPKTNIPTTEDSAEPAILTERTEQWLLVTIGLLFGLAVAFASRRLIELWTLSQHAKATRLAGFINEINPFRDHQAKTREDVERILTEQSKTLVEMATALDKAAGEGDDEKLVQQGQLVAPEGKELNTKITELLNRLEDLSRAGEDKAWREAVAHLHDLNQKHQLSPSTFEPPTKDQNAFDQLVGIPFQIVASVKQMIEGRTDVDESGTLQARLASYRRVLDEYLEAYEQTESELSDLLDSRSVTTAETAAQADPGQTPLKDRFDQFFRSVFDPLRDDTKQLRSLLDQRGAPADAELTTRVETYLDAFESSIQSVKDYFGAGEDIETRQLAIAQLEEAAGPIRLLQEATANAVVDLETATQKREIEAEVRASLHQASQAVARYHDAKITARNISPPPESTSALDLANHLNRELAELVSDAEKNRQSKFFSVVLNLAMKGNVHLNQGISSWRSTHGNRLMLDYLATGLNKLNLYALELLGSDQLKPIDAANLLSGTNDHPGQFLSILRILARIQTLRAYTGIWDAMPTDAQQGFLQADLDLRNLLIQLGIKPHTFELLGDPKNLKIPYKPIDSKIVIEEPEFRAELGRLHREQTIVSNEVVIEVRQLGFEVDPEGLSALKQEDSPTYLCITKIDLIERYALETT